MLVLRVLQWLFSSFIAKIPPELMRAAIKLFHFSLPVRLMARDSCIDSGANLKRLRSIVFCE